MNPSSSVRIRAILFEEHATLSDLISRYLEAKLRGSFEILGTARNMPELTKLCHKNAPDIIIFEPLHSEILPLDIVHDLLQISKKTKLLAFSRSRSAFLFLEMRSIGVRGVVTRDVPLSTLVEAVKAVASGDFFFPEDSISLQESTPLPTLTERERQVIYLVSLGYPTSAIAQKMTVTKKTIDKFRQKIMNKVNAHDAVALTRFALTNGLSRI